MKINITENNLPRVVIVGGGFGGITLAEALKNEPVQVVMFDKNNYHTFQPLLYQVATGGLEPDSIAFPIRKMFKGIENFHFRMAEVQRIDPSKRKVHTNIGEIEYDYLVLATGSQTNFFGMKELEEHSVGMKNIPEALDLRSLILQNFEQALLNNDVEEREALMNFVVVGAGPTGVETAGALAELKRHILPKDYPELDLRRMQIHLIEAGSTVLPGMSGESSHNALKGLQGMSVNVWLDTFVTGYDGQKVVTQKGREIPSKTVIWSAGVVGSPVEGVDEAIGDGNRIKVDQFNRINGQERVFAIGDVALMATEAYPDGHPMVSPVAIQQAQQLAENIRAWIRDLEPKKFQYFDKGTMATIGRNRAVVDVNRMRFKGSFAWLLWMGVHLFYLAGFRNKLVVFINWFWSYITYDRGTRLIIRPFKRKATKVPVSENKEPVSV